MYDCRCFILKLSLTYYFVTIYYLLIVNCCVLIRVEYTGLEVVEDIGILMYNVLRVYIRFI